MCGFNRSTLTAGLIVAAIDVAAEAAPPNFSSPRIAPSAPEVMIYFSHSFGGAPGATGTRSSFEIRAQQVRQIGNSADPKATGDAMRHQEWLSWKTDTGSDFHVSAMQLRLAKRLTYDLTDPCVAPPTYRLGMPPAAASEGNGQLATRPRPVLALQPAPALAPTKQMTSGWDHVRVVGVH
jgi:hypothetical protein